MISCPSDALAVAIRHAGWELPADEWVALGAGARAFAEIELTAARTPAAYAQRVTQLGMSGLARVLDAGCGIGQWSTALARLNGEVVGIDPLTERIAFARAFAAANHVPNVRFEVAGAEATGLAEGSVDAVLCYGVFMFTDMPRAIAEFHRVLRPGGRVYVNANSWGWYAHMLIDRAIRNRGYGGRPDAYTPPERRTWSRNVRVGLTRAVLGRPSQRLVTRSFFTRELERAGRFRVLAMGTEGSIDLAGRGTGPRFYDPEFYGMTAVLEAVAERR